MHHEIEGVYHADLGTKVINDKFSRRQFIVALTDTVNGVEHTNYAKVQLEKDRVTMLDRFSIGDKIKVSFNIKGIKNSKDEYITNLRVFQIIKAE